MNSPAIIPASTLAAAKSEPDAEVFLESVEGYASMLLYRGDKSKTAADAARILKNVARSVNSPIWSSAAIESRGERRRLEGIGARTLRKEQIIIEHFTRYLLDPRYGWIERFVEAYGALPNQPIHDRNRIMHVEENESGRHVRPLTWEELYAFTARCDFIARNGITAREQRIALRDGTVFKTGAGLGLRVMEMADCRLSACSSARDGTPFSAIRIFGKSKARGPARPRTVHAIDLFPWVSKVLVHHVAHIMPLFTNGDGDHLFVNEDGRPLDPHYISVRFGKIRDDAGLPKAVTAHGLRRFWATECAVAGIDTAFISKMLGHESPITTQAYILPQRDFIDRKVREYQTLLLRS